MDPGIPDKEKMVMQVDLENAFNQVDREEAFLLIRQHFPEISHWVESAYGSQAHLIFGNSRILSCQGFHQGDPL